MKFIVNDRCIGCGLCTNLCPELFEMTDAGSARAKDEEIVSEDVRSRALESKEGCPVDAIEQE